MVSKRETYIWLFENGNRKWLINLIYWNYGQMCEQCPICVFLRQNVFFSVGIYVKLRKKINYFLNMNISRIVLFFLVFCVHIVWNRYLEIIIVLLICTSHKLLLQIRIFAWVGAVTFKLFERVKVTVKVTIRIQQNTNWTGILPTGALRNPIQTVRSSKS